MVRMYSFRWKGHLRRGAWTALEDKGLVRDHNLFYLQLKLSAYSGHIKPGIYTLNTSMTAKDMMVIMSSDKSDEEQTQTVEPSDTQ